MPKAWEKQDDETDAWYANFVVYMGIGYGRTLSKAYRLVHPDSEATEVSAAWREEYRTRKWRSRATQYDLSLFQEQSLETVVMMSRGVRAFARKALRALLSKDPAMRPRTWEETQAAFGILWRLLPDDVVKEMAAFGREDKGPGGPQHRPEDIDADGYLKEPPEDMPEEECVRLEREKWGAEQDKVRTGEIPIYRREVYTPPEPSPPPAG